MSWTTPRTWVSGELVTASLMNTHVRDNLNALRADSGDMTSFVRRSGIISPTLSGSPNHDYNPTGLASAGVIRFSGAGATYQITGIAAQPSGTELECWVITNEILRFLHNDSGSAAANRILTPTAALVELGQNDGAGLWYDGTTQCWRLKIWN